MTNLEKLKTTVTSINCTLKMKSFKFLRKQCKFICQAQKKALTRIHRQFLTPILFSVLKSWNPNQNKSLNQAHPKSIMAIPLKLNKPQHVSLKILCPLQYKLVSVKKNLYKNTMHDKILYLNVEQWTSQHTGRKFHLFHLEIYLYMTDGDKAMTLYIYKSSVYPSTNEIHIVCLYVHQKPNGWWRVKRDLQYRTVWTTTWPWKRSYLHYRMECLLKWAGHRLMAQNLLVA